jgi:hypothetical protein
MVCVCARVCAFRATWGQPRVVRDLVELCTAEAPSQRLSFVRIQDALFSYFCDLTPR